MQFQDKQLTCVDCGNQFTFTASEQEFYDKKGFTNEPKRCPDCRMKKKQQMGGGGRGNFSSGPRQSFEITCAQCGAKDTVPFQPKGDRPVLCRNCFRSSRTA